MVTITSKSLNEIEEKNNFFKGFGHRTKIYLDPNLGDYILEIFFKTSQLN